MKNTENTEQDNLALGNNLIEPDDNAGEVELNEIFKKINKLTGNSEENEEISPIKEVIEEENNNLDEEEELQLSEELQENEEDEEETLKSKKSSKDEPKWKIKRDKFKVLAEKKALLDELSSERAQKEYLQQLLDESLQSGNYHYEQSTISAFEKAKEKNRQALTEGNHDLYIESTIEMNDALNNLRELKRVNYNPPPSSPIQYNNYLPNNTYDSSDNNEIYEQLASAWIEKHEYLQSDSEEYNPRLAKQVWSYVKTIDDDYAKKNKSDKIFSDQYFDEIDSHIKDLRRISSKPKTIDSGAPIGGVKNSYYSPARNKSVSSQKPELTADERIMAYNAGVSEDVWRHYKAEQLKTTKTRR